MPPLLLRAARLPDGTVRDVLIDPDSGLVGRVAAPGLRPVGPDELELTGHLLPWRTVLANVELFAELAGTAKAERRERALDALRLVGLEGVLRSKDRVARHVTLVGT